MLNGDCNKCKRTGILDETNRQCQKCNFPAAAADISKIKAVMDKLGEAWNLFMELPANEKHPSDNDEFIKAIHAAQNILYYQAFIKKHGKL